MHPSPRQLQRRHLRRARAGHGGRRLRPGRSPLPWPGRQPRSGHRRRGGEHRRHAQYRPRVRGHRDRHLLEAARRAEAARPVVGGAGMTIARGAHHRVALTVNRQPRTVEVPARCTLAEALRGDLGLTGTKVGCNRAECGSCAWSSTGAPFSCSVLAVEAAGRVVETVEGCARLRRPSSPAGPRSSSTTRSSVAHLHPGHAHVAQGPAGRDAHLQRGRRPSGGGRQPLPLRDLSEHGEGGAGRGERAAPRSAGGRPR